MTLSQHRERHRESDHVRDCGQEIRRPAERGGARNARSVRPHRQASGRPGPKGPDPAQSRCLRGGRGLERPTNRGRAGHHPLNRIANPPASGRRRLRSGLAPQAVPELRQATHLRRRLRGQTDRPGLFGTPQRPGEVDPAAVGRQGRGIEHRRARQRQHDWPDAQKNILKPHLNQQFVIPPEANAAFVANMEDVLEVYHQPRDPECPLVCLDETSKQLVAETRVAIPAKPGRVARYDYEYERNGTANLFMLFAPLQGWRHVEVTDRHTAVDFAHLVKDLSDKHFPNARKIKLVQDNLNTHKPASLYEAFPAAEARRLVERFEWHYTPKHGSWLDMAESELSVLSGQCLDRRMLAPLQIRSYLLMSRSSPRSAQPERALQSGFGGARRERGRRPRIQLVLRIRTAARRRG